MTNLLIFAPDLLSYCCDSRELEETGFCGNCHDHATFYLEEEVIAQKLDENISPDALVSCIGGDVAQRRIEVGQVMRERANRANRANRAVTQARTHQEYFTTLYTFYRLKDKWRYWHRKWGLTWAAIPIKKENNVRSP